MCTRNVQVVKIFNVMIAECYHMIVYLKANLDLKTIYIFLCTQIILITQVY